MARWDLSKLPEGRKPLPDEWFAERVQMQERIKELEANLAEYKHVASAIDTQWAESQDEIADLKAKLAKAVSFSESVVRYARKGGDGYLWDQARTTLAELTGGKYE